MKENFYVYNVNELENMKSTTKSKEDKYVGYVYIIDCVNCVKIGCTKNPFSRITEWIRVLEKYGKHTVRRIAVSKKHTNYYENEHSIHSKFNSKRIDSTELFELEFETALSFADLFLEFKNDSIKIEEQKNRASNDLIEILFFKRLGEDINFDLMTDMDIERGLKLLKSYKLAREEVALFFKDFID